MTACIFGDAVDGSWLGQAQGLGLTYTIGRAKPSSCVLEFGIGCRLGHGADESPRLKVTHVRGWPVHHHAQLI